MTLSRPIKILLLAMALLYAAFQSVATMAFDFRAFYCAGRVVVQGADPYRTQPLHSCESTQTDSSYAGFAKVATLPAPIPAYDVALFIPFSKLPFWLAKLIWTLILSAAIAAAAICLTLLTRLSPVTIFCGLWLSLIFPSLAYGEIIPISIAGICFAALCAHKHRWGYAALGALVSLVEPHLGLPVCIVLAVASRKSWPVLIVGTLSLVAISLTTLPFSENLEYLTVVLPLHALSELASDAQLSLSVILHYSNVNDAAAIRVGAGAYALLVVVACYVARAMSRRYNDAAFIVAVPAAFAVIGGTFIHVTDIPAAFLLALLLYRYGPQYRASVIAAIALIALPWWHLALILHQGQTAVIGMTAAVTLALVWDLSGKDLRLSLVSGVFAAIALVLVNSWYVASSDAFHLVAHVPAPHINPKYPEASWGWANTRYISTGVPASWALRIPSWLGLLILLWTSVVLAFHSRRHVNHQATVAQPPILAPQKTVT